MKREECTIGAEVYTDDGFNYRYTVTSLPNCQDMVQVVPSNKSWGELDSFHLDDLHLYDLEKIKRIAAEYQARINTAKTAFEAAFAALGNIRDEYKDGVSMYSLQDAKLLSLKELESVIDSNGWSSSSLWC